MKLETLPTSALTDLITRLCERTHRLDIDSPANARANFRMNRLTLEYYNRQLIDDAQVSDDIDELSDYVREVGTELGVTTPTGVAPDEVDNLIEVYPFPHGVGVWFQCRRTDTESAFALTFNDATSTHILCRVHSKGMSEERYFVSANVRYFVNPEAVGAFGLTVCN